MSINCQNQYPHQNMFPQYISYCSTFPNYNSSMNFQNSNEMFKGNNISVPSNSSQKAKTNSVHFFPFINHVNHQNAATQGNTRVLFKKEDDEKIKKLVEIFGTGHWDLIAQFMQGRTAKQCRDRYSNYLIPGFFQGEWSNEEDDLLIQLYKENGPKWSIIKKSFANRSANNIKNRWYYFLHKKVKNDEDIKCNVEVHENDNKTFEKNKDKPDSNEMNDGNSIVDNDDFLIQQENEIFEIFGNNAENENNWMLFN